MAEKLKDLWAAANEALMKAKSLPWGPERIEALRAAGLLRNRAARAEIAQGQTNKNRQTSD
jgi:hypothetical protein